MGGLNCRDPQCLHFGTVNIFVNRLIFGHGHRIQRNSSALTVAEPERGACQHTIAPRTCHLKKGDNQWVGSADASDP